MKNNAPYTGYLFAIAATLIWSGNFVVARDIAGKVPPISLAFFRWSSATIIILPIALKKWQEEQQLLKKHLGYLLASALFGITLYNTFIYKSGSQVPAIELALITTTTSPVFSMLLAAVFLKEKIRWLQLIGLALCLSGILVLLSGGHLERLMELQFSSGISWLILAALFFAVYNILVRKKPMGMTSLPFLLSIFFLGSVLLLPAFLWETQVTTPIAWNTTIFVEILYLGLGNSVISYLCWNSAISKLGAAKTALFGNLIPVFSSIEAVLFLGEEFGYLHFIGGLLVILGLTIANIRNR